MVLSACSAKSSNGTTRTRPSSTLYSFRWSSVTIQPSFKPVPFPAPRPHIHTRRRGRNLSHIIVLSGLLSGLGCGPLWPNLLPRPELCKKGNRTSPLREGGGAAVDGIQMDSPRQATGAATGGVLRLAVTASATPHRKQADRPCGSLHRRQAAVPLSRRGGECLRGGRSPGSGFQAASLRVPSAKLPKAQKFSNHWKKIFQSLENFAAGRDARNLDGRRETGRMGA
jgi:hypothetical protein